MLKQLGSNYSLQNGVIQGYTQVPFLIIIVPDYALSQVICKIRIVPEKDKVMKAQSTTIVIQNSLSKTPT